LVVRRLFFAFVAGSVAVAAGRSAHGAVPGKPAIGEVVKDFTAKDVLGGTFSLSQIDRDKIVVLAFLGVECPLAKLYTPRLVELVNKYQTRGILFLAVDSNRQDSVTQIAAYARRHAITLPVLKDLRQTIADRLGTTRTPEVVVLDRKHRIRYRGRIDDQFGFVPTNRAVSYRQAKPHRNDLQRALDELLAGTPVSVPETDTVGCLIGRDREPSAHSTRTYAKDVAPILNKRCVACHRPNQIAPFALTSYEEAAGWADMISEVTELNRMPPWHADPRYGSFRNDARLSDEEKRVLHQWAADGAPQGDARDLPEPPKFADGWMIPEPDEIISMSQQPYDVPATGIIPYRDFVVDPGWKTDRWLSAIEARPGNPSVVHHILIFVIPPGGGRHDFLRADDMYLATYIPGARPEPLAPGLARPVRAGSKFLFNIHYTPNGSPHQDCSYLGVKFADPGSVVREVTVSCAFNTTFQIPPAASNHEVKCQYVFQRDSLLLSLIPHMHYRGKDFLFEAQYPNGDIETLLSVPHYDFAWQTVYRLKEPKVVPRGTVIQCLAHYDNSEANLNNPNPQATVAWGEQTFDEMMIGAFEIAPAAEGVVHRTRWWTPHESQFSAEAIGAVILTIVNGCLIAALLVGAVRSRRGSRIQPTQTSHSAASLENSVRLGFKKL
jgi:peroxiredoxin